MIFLSSKRVSSEHYHDSSNGMIVLANGIAIYLIISYDMIKKMNKEGMNGQRGLNIELVSLEY